MCGIAGMFVPAGRVDADVLQRMTTRIAHRGPDDAGYWQDSAAGIGLGHRRLAIVDLSPGGHQPMHSASGRYVMVFNGEVYNFKDLRRDLDRERRAPEWRGSSDTEVMLAAIEAWGLSAAVTRFVGMFAFALWDREARQLHLVRDRLGIKPLYCGWLGRDFVFGSELKALRATSQTMPPVDRSALTLLLRHNYIPAPHTIYEGVYKLAPGTVVTLSADDVIQPRSWEYLVTRAVPFWSARDVAERGVADPFIGTDAEAQQELERLLSEAVRVRMIADVPLGAFLSGGVDSSVVVATMQQISDRPIRTFAMGFEHREYDEAQYAHAVAAHLGTEHTELYVTSADAMNVIPHLPELYDEPFADSSQIPTFLVSKLARRQVTVSLSGDGGDELFGGYNRYFWGRRLWQRIGLVPAPARRVLARLLGSISQGFWDATMNPIMPLLPRRLRVRQPGDKMRRLIDVLDHESPDALYYQLVSHWTDAATVVVRGHEPQTVLTDPNRRARLPDYTARMMYADLVTYLPDDILVKVDRASMGVALEARVPLIDHRLVEFAARLPLSMKIRHGEGKWLLRQVLYQHVPKELIDRPKMGFGVPIDHWLRGPLRDWAEDLLSEDRLRREGFFHPAPIRKKWAEHLSGHSNHQYHLWDILMFQAWWEWQTRAATGTHHSSFAISG
ncbi:MAG: asparagine synthase (glutamine-hydrolyzing) [Acidiferrobacter sp.]